MLRNLRTYAREWLRYNWLPALFLAALAFGAGAVLAQTPTGTMSVSVGAGNVPSVTWAVAGATSCTASGGWTGTRAVSGTQAQPAITASTAYNLACAGAADTQATLTCTPPTQNTDGTAITDLAGFRFYHGTSASSLTDIKQVAGSTCAAQYTGLSLGTHFFGVTAYNLQGAESAMSGVGSKAITAAQTATFSVKVNVPKAPALTVVDPTAFNVDFQLKGLKFVLAKPVGTVPVGAACDNDFKLAGGYYRVARKDVTFSGKAKPAVVVARCAYT